MIKTRILIVLLLQLFYTLIQGHESPCPQYFKYKIKSGTDETIGEINIQSPPRSGTLHLKVILKIPAALHTKYVGRLELARSAEKSAKAVQQGRNLLYNLHFPLRQPIPILFKMWFNDEQYCSGSDIKGSYVTTITLQHTFYLPNVQNSKTTSKSTQSKKKRVNLSQGIGNNIFLNRIPSQSTSLYNNVFLNPISSQLTPGHSNNNNNIFLQPSAANPTAQNNNNNNSWDNIFLSSSVNPILQNNSSNNNNNNNCKNNSNNNNDNINKNYNECGVSGRTGNTNLLIANGQETMPGQWPWLVAIFVVRQEYKFQCAGSVLTTRHVITAAHCMMLHSNSNVTLHPNVLEVALGRFNLHRFRERGTVNREVASYKIHPDYLYGNNADSDLAILVLRTPVKFSSFIRPICLWSQSTDLQTVVNRVGYVVGWGQDEHGYFTEEPRLTFMPIVTQDTCHWSHESFIFFTSNRTFCAGMRNGSGPCNGDSGSGLVLFDATTSRYQLRGIVSRSIFGGDSPCDFTKFTIFVDAAKYSPWIQEQIST